MIVILFSSSDISGSLSRSEVETLHVVTVWWDAVAVNHG